MMSSIEFKYFCIIACFVKINLSHDASEWNKVGSTQAIDAVFGYKILELSPSILHSRMQELGKIKQLCSELREDAAESMHNFRSMPTQHDSSCRNPMFGVVQKCFLRSNLNLAIRGGRRQGSKKGHSKSSKKSHASHSKHMDVEDEDENDSDIEDDEDHDEEEMQSGDDSESGSGEIFDSEGNPEGSDNLPQERSDLVEVDSDGKPIRPAAPKKVNNTLLYSFLGLPAGADVDAVKKAFRSISERCSKSKKGSLDELNRAQQAYEILKDPRKKAYYDKHGDKILRQDDDDEEGEDGEESEEKKDPDAAVNDFLGRGPLQSLLSSGGAKDKGPSLVSRTGVSELSVPEGGGEAGGGEEEEEEDGDGMGDTQQSSS